MTEQPWALSWRADPFVAGMADRHYSRKTPGAVQFSPPGRVLVLRASDAAWVSLWSDPRYADHDYPGAWLCTLFRNEGPLLSSALVTAAVAATRWKWPTVPEQGMVTFVDPGKTRRKRDPGRCFRRAGFRHVGFTKDRKLYVLQLAPEDMPYPLPPLLAQESMFGAAFVTAVGRQPAGEDKP